MSPGRPRRKAGTEVGTGRLLCAFGRPYADHQLTERCTPRCAELAEASRPLLALAYQGDSLRELLGYAIADLGGTPDDVASQSVRRLVALLWDRERQALGQELKYLTNPRLDQLRHIADRLQRPHDLNRAADWCTTLAQRIIELDRPGPTR